MYQSDNDHDHPCKHVKTDHGSPEQLSNRRHRTQHALAAMPKRTKALTKYQPTYVPNLAIMERPSYSKHCDLGDDFKEFCPKRDAIPIAMFALVPYLSCTEYKTIRRLNKTYLSACNRQEIAGRFTMSSLNMPTRALEDLIPESIPSHVFSSIKIGHPTDKSRDRFPLLVPMYDLVIHSLPATIVKLHLVNTRSIINLDILSRALPRLEHLELRDVCLGFSWMPRREDPQSFTTRFQEPPVYRLPDNSIKVLTNMPRYRCTAPFVIKPVPEKWSSLKTLIIDDTPCLAPLRDSDYDFDLMNHVSKIWDTRGDTLYENSISDVPLVASCMTDILLGMALGPNLQELRMTNTAARSSLKLYQCGPALRILKMEHVAFQGGILVRKFDAQGHEINHFDPSGVEELSIHLYEESQYFKGVPGAMDQWNDLFGVSIQKLQLVIPQKETSFVKHHVEYLDLSECCALRELAMAFKHYYHRDFFITPPPNALSMLYLARYCRTINTVMDISKFHLPGITREIYLRECDDGSQVLDLGGYEEANCHLFNLNTIQCNFKSILGNVDTVLGYNRPVIIDANIECSH